MRAVSKAVGFSRTPDAELVNRPEALHARFVALRAEVARLEDEGMLVVHAPDIVDEAVVDEAWHPVLASFRILTMSATAASARLDPAFTANLYESAADAALLSGNLGTYVSCQSRLNQLYLELKHLGEPALDRADEFKGYNLLYFGVFAADPIEVAGQLLRLKESSVSAEVRFALKVIMCVRTQHGCEFLNLYDGANLRQKCILKPRLDAMRSVAARTIVRSYLRLEIEYARKLLHGTNELVFKTILAQQPELAHLNMDMTASEIVLRVPKLKS